MTSCNCYIVDKAGGNFGFSVHPEFTCGGSLPGEPVTQPGLPTDFGKAGSTTLARLRGGEFVMTRHGLNWSHHWSLLISFARDRL